MATYPNNLYEPRNFENLPGLNRLTADKKNLYAEDLNETNAEVVAIETILGKNPNGAYASVKAWLEALASGGGGGTWGTITGTLSNQLDLALALSEKEATANKKTSLTDNSDTYYPTQKAVKTAIDAKQDSLGFTPENASNKKTAFQTTPTDEAYVSEKLVKTSLDNKISKNVASEFASLGSKTTLTDYDSFLIEDSGAYYAKKKTYATYLANYIKSMVFNGSKVGTTELQGFCPYFDPLKSSTYYIGANLVVPVAGADKKFNQITWLGGEAYISRIRLKHFRKGTQASFGSSSVYLTINSTDYLISSSQYIGYFDYDYYVKSDLEIPIDSLDTISLKIVTRDWTTEPTQVCFQYELCISDVGIMP